MKKPYLSEVSRQEQTVNTFGGYCHKETAAAGQFYDMQNMTGNLYPLASVREPQGIVERTDNKPETLIGLNELWSVRRQASGTSYLYREEVPVTKADGEKIAFDAVGERLTARCIVEMNSCILDLAYKGDVNGDGNIFASDLILLRKYLDGSVRLTKEQRNNADINNDGVVDRKDLVLLSKIVSESVSFKPKEHTLYIVTLVGDRCEEDVPAKIRAWKKVYTIVDKDNKPKSAKDIPLVSAYKFENGCFVYQPHYMDKLTVVPMGAKLVFFPDKKVYNTVFADTNCPPDRLEGQTEWEDIEVYGEFDDVSCFPCRLEDEKYRDIVCAESDTGPSDPKNGDYWYDTKNQVLKQYTESDKSWVSVPTVYTRIEADGIGAGLKEGDGINLKIGIDGLDGDQIVWKRDEEYIVVTGNPIGGVVDYPVIVQRTCPDMDYVIESENRLWGCNSEKHEIYASKLGDPTNWNCFMGVSADSYAATVGSQGEFTGIGKVGEYVLFFKKDRIIRLYGTRPSNYKLTEFLCPGVQKGSYGSIVNINEALYYKADDGIYVTTGGIPTKISGDLGEVHYTDATACRWGNRYVVCMQSEYGEWHVLVYDTTKGIWHKYRDTRMISMASVGNEMYYAYQDGVEEMTDAAGLHEMVGTYAIRSMGGSLGYSGDGLVPGAQKEDEVEWYIETPEIESVTPDNLTITQMRLRVSLAPKSRMLVKLRYDEDTKWQEVYGLATEYKRNVIVPLLLRRCERFKIRIEGIGDCKLYTMTNVLEQGSEYHGRI